MEPLDLAPALRAALAADPALIPEVLLSVAGKLGATDVVMYLVDFAQTTLEPVPDRRAHAEVPQSEDVSTTMAGRAFVDQRATIAERPDGTRVWVPIIEGSDRTGVLALTVPATTDAIIGACEEVGIFAGYLIATQTRATDFYNLYRRRRALSLAASMQWDLLPPLVLKTGRIAVAGLLEPAYEVGGDCFDYALNDAVFNLAVVDAAGHGVPSALISALIIGSYRHDRRESRTLEQIHQNLDKAVAAYLPELTFATGQLVRIDLESGALTLTNAGHPCPLLIRGGRVIQQLDCPPTLPWGFGSLANPPKATPVTDVALEPGDGLLFYTDGVVEAHMAGGDHFGVERLADLASQHSSDQIEPEEVVRRLVGAVLEHQNDKLADDATLVLIQWNGPTLRR